MERGAFRHDGRDYIDRSHQRCRNYGIATDQVFSSLILEGRELKNRLAGRSALIAVAEPFINQLYAFVKGSGFFAILTDEDGCILRVIGDDEIASRARALRMIPGAFMDEAHIGTNAMGTALAEGAAVQVSGDEHFVKAYHGWTCSAAPIRNIKGEIIGALDLTGHKATVHSHTMGMVVAAVDAIGTILKMQNYTAELQRSKAYTETVIDSLHAGIMTVQLDGEIRTVSKHAAAMFGFRQERMLQMPIRNLLDGWETIRQAVLAERPFIEEDVAVSARSNKVRFCVSAYPVSCKRGGIQDIVLVLKELRKARKLADQIIGRRALYTFDKIIGQNPAFLEAISFAKKMADSRSTLLILGESGTGKELFAQAVHNHSERRDETFVAINCGALPRTLIESELFGYEEGAFTGAKRSGQPGKFELADGGTLFLDEIGEMPLDLQTRLLRVIEEGTVCRIGGSREIPVDVRIIAASNKELSQEVDRGNFRADLFFRLHVLPLELPPLRQRMDDLPLLLDFFMQRLSRRLNRKIVPLPPEYLQQLLAYHWPGNVRELENLVELLLNNGSLVPAPGSRTGCDPLGSLQACSTVPVAGVRAAAAADRNAPLPCLSLLEAERLHIQQVLLRYPGNISLVARTLGIGRNTLYRKMTQHRLDYPQAPQQPESGAIASMCTKIEHCSKKEQISYDQAVPFYNSLKYPLY